MLREGCARTVGADAVLSGLGRTGSPYADLGEGCTIEEAGDADRDGMSREPRPGKLPFVLSPYRDAPSDWTEAGGDGSTIEGTDVAAEERLAVSALEGSRAWRGRNALGGGMGSREGVLGRVRTGVPDLSGGTAVGGLDRSGESARGGLRGLLGREDDRALGVEGAYEETPLMRPFCFGESEYPLAAGRRGDAGGRGAPPVGVGARSIRVKLSGGGLDAGEECSNECTSNTEEATYMLRSGRVCLLVPEVLFPR